MKYCFFSCLFELLLKSIALPGLGLRTAGLIGAGLGPAAEVGLTFGVFLAAADAAGTGLYGV